MNNIAEIKKQRWTKKISEDFKSYIITNEQGETVCTIDLGSFGKKDPSYVMDIVTLIEIAPQLFEAYCANQYVANENKKIIELNNAV